MENECQQIDENIRSVVRSQTTTAQDGRGALSEAQNVIGHLFEQIIEIKTRAEKTEDMVKEITRDIKQLDWAKKNLTSAITTLNHLHILVGGIENLSKLVENRQYGELLNPLQAIIEVNKHFQKYTEIPKIKVSSRNSSHEKIFLWSEINELLFNGIVFSLFFRSGFVSEGARDPGKTCQANNGRCPQYTDEFDGITVFGR